MNCFIFTVMFQFHKVRLKEISFRLVVLLTVFQFHKVRLKGATGKTAKITLDSVFQFHKVRLKEGFAERMKV